METCKCGKVHRSSVKEVFGGSGAISRLPEAIAKLGGTKAFILADENTFAAAGDKVTTALDGAGIPFAKYVLKSGCMPDEKTIGSSFAHFDNSCDVVVGVGSGVINDTSKIVSKVSRRPYISVATAPSMDGYASVTSSMDIDGLKTSLKTKCAEIIIGDTDVLKNAPMRMLRAGLGDMLAKYVSICEWRISHLVTGEYYCEYIASLIRTALKECVDNANGLINRDEKAVEAVFRGLILAGQGMEYAENTRVASGMEHSLSHIWDMRDLAFHTKSDLHGIQCGVATLIAAKCYEQLVKIKPCREKAMTYAKNFDLDEWNEQLRAFIGKGAEAMIALDKKEKKYGLAKHEARLDRIIDGWDEILKIVSDELPSSARIEEILNAIGAPTSCEQIGVDPSTLPMTFRAAKDLRDKYILPRLCWDLGILDEIKL